MSTEAIYAALFDAVRAVPGIVSASRRLKHWDNVRKEAQPALFQQQGVQQEDRAARQPARLTLAANLIVYFRTDGELVPGTVANPLIDGIRAALAPTGPAYLNTLGGLVERAFISGQIDLDEGTLDGQGVITIPITLITTAP